MQLRKRQDIIITKDFYNLIKKNPKSNFLVFFELGCKMCILYQGREEKERDSIKAIGFWENEAYILLTVRNRPEDINKAIKEVREMNEHIIYAGHEEHLNGNDFLRDEITLKLKFISNG